MFVNILDHIAITVGNMERSLSFYRDLLGLREEARHRLEYEPISTMTGKKDVIMNVVRLVSPATPAVRIDLQEYVQPEGKVSEAKLGDVAHAHVCFGVKDLMQVYEELKMKGVKFVSAPVTFDLEHEGVIKVVFLEDPDGFVIEFTELLEGGV